MRQVPRYLVIGSGKMATHFCHYLSLLSLPYLQWSRKTQSLADLQTKSSQASHIIVLISDTHIPSLIDTLTLNTHTVLVHFSGMLSLTKGYSAHPLMTFSSDLYDLERYKEIPFILEQGSPPLSTLLPGLPNPSYFIPKERKPFYHALCVMSNNFSCLLWNKIFTDISTTLNLPKDIVLPYLKQTFSNIAKNPQGALTGPLARGDEVTIHKHIEALQEDNFSEIYQAFVNFYQHSRGQS